MLVFLLLSCVSGALETGVLFYGWANSLPWWEVLALALMYQLGNLLSLFVRNRRAALAVSCVVVLLFTALYALFQIRWFLFITTACCSSSIQIGRSAYKSTCRTWIKRSFRVLGFALSPFAALIMPWFIAAAGAAALVAAGSHSSPVKRRKPFKIYSVMIFHQIHYFVYIYALVLWVLCQNTSITATVILFVAGWAVYILPQAISGRFPQLNRAAMFFVCHTFLSLVMLAITVCAAANLTTAVCGLWILTGLGGGSVFCIESLSPRYERAEMDFSENLGHVLGASLAVILALPLRDACFPFCAAASFISVITALLCGVSVRKKGGADHV